MWTMNINISNDSLTSKETIIVDENYANDVELSAINGIYIDWLSTLSKSDL